MTASTPSSERILVARAILEGESVDDDLAAFLGSVDTVLVGYHVVPEQTAPSQMRRQFEAQAMKVLDEIATDIEAAGGTVEKRLIFTHEREQSLDRIEREAGTTAELLPNPTGPVESMLVPIRGEVQLDRLGSFVSRLRGDRPVQIEFLVAAEGKELEAARPVLDEIYQYVVELGTPEELVRSRIIETETPVDAIVQAAIDHDVTVMGERIPDWRSIIFGELEDRVAKESLGPVFVVYPTARTEKK